MVALGWAQGSFIEDSIEIIDLLNTEKICPLFPKFPHKTAPAVAGLLPGGAPIICGAKYPEFSDSCHAFKDGNWTLSSSLTVRRRNFPMVVLPTGEMIITGGESNTAIGIEYLKRTDILVVNGTWLNTQMDLPISMAYHCMVLADSKTLMAIGGQHAKNYGQRTYKLSLTQKVWMEGPALITARGAHACSKIPSSRMSKKESIIVAGGWTENNTGLSSVEILDHDFKKWRLGPELPKPLHGVSIVRHPDGGVVLIGGSNSGTYSDALYYLPHAGPGAQWEKLPQTLGKGRDFHASILVPDEILDYCIDEN